MPLTRCTGAARRSGTRVLPALLLVAATLGFVAPPAGAVPFLVTADAETVPVLSSGDAADDPAIWRHPTDPARSLIIGNDKGGSLDVYDLDGTRIQRITDGSAFFGNVDVRTGFPLDGETVDLAGVSRAGLRFYRIDPATRLLGNVTDGGSVPTGGGEGLCMYRSPTSGRFYTFHVARDGRVEQYELGDDDGDGLVDGDLVRSWDIGSEAEGCVADDELGDLYVSEENVGIWRYGAEPDSPTISPTSVDVVGAAGHLVADVEGLTIVNQPGGTGYVIASSQGDNRFVVYERQGANDFVGDFSVASGATADGCSGTDGIAALAAGLGADFPFGIFVCQDGQNTTPGGSGNQDFKVVRLERILTLDGGPPPPPAPIAFAPQADARVAQGSPDQNFGTTASLEVDATPPVESYLRFEVTGLDGPVERAVLRLFAVTGSVNGPELYPSGASWTETGITWNNRPARTGGLLDDRGSVAAGVTAEYDVTAAVTGEGTFSFELAGDSGDGVDFRSREAAVNPPLLVVSTGVSGPDVTPPETSITAGPSGTVTTTSVSFSFSASERGSTFECGLDGAAFSACESPQAYPDLADGPHIFEVRATDAAGNTDGSPAGRSFTVDTSAPPPSEGIAFRSAASNGSPAGRASVTVAVPVGTAVGDVMVASVVINDGDPAFTAPAGWALVRQDTMTNLLRQAVYVRVATAAEPASYTWTMSAQRRVAAGIATYIGVDTAQPVDVHGGQNNPTASTAVTAPSVSPTVAGALLVHFAAVNAEGSLTPPAGMTERWEAAAPRSGSTRDALAASSDEIRDSSGATGTRAATAVLSGRSIGALVALRPARPAVPDLDPPDTAITSGPSGTVGTGSVVFSFSASEAPSTFECALDGAAFGGCETPVSYGDLVDGPHEFAVRATDAAGNTDASPASRSFTVDTSAPPPPERIVFRAAASSGSADGRSAVTVGVPAGTVAGDVMVAAVVSNDDDPAFTAPAGWTLVRQDSMTDVLRQAVYVRVASVAEPASYTWTLSTQRRVVAGIATYTGVDTAQPVDAHGARNNTTASTAVTAPSITTASPGALVLHIGAVNAEGTISPPTAMTERWEGTAPRAGSTRDATVSCSDQIRDSAGATGTATATASLPGRSIAAQVALRPA